MIKFICYLEKKIIRYKQKYALKVNEKFLKKYQLTDLEMRAKIKAQYNPYQQTGIFLIDSLIEKEYIKKDDYILDVGSGTGLFLLYLASKGFKNLYGVEIDEEYHNCAISNLNKMHLSSNQKVVFDCCDIFDKVINDDINVFYLFNTFYDKETYLAFFKLVEESLKRNKRKIQIIILFPTISSISALNETEWLHRKGRVFNQKQVCSRCNYFLIYANDIRD